MKSFFSNRRNYTILLSLIAILLFGGILRHDRFSTIPRQGSTFDEFAWTWLGINLIQKHTPISWSSQPQYTNRQHLIYQGAAFWIVKPYLEHPPLFGLVAGSFALLNGAKDMYSVTIANMRPLALILGVFSIAMIYLLTNEIYGKEIALISSLFYATVPTMVIGSRIVQNENFLIPFWLLSLYIISKYLKTGKKRFRNTAAILAGLLSLAKVPWLVVGLSLSMILSFKGKWRDAFFLGAVTLIIFSIYIFYGLYFDKNLFINLLKLQTARYDISFAGIFSIFTSPLLVDRYYLDGWILFGWLSIVLTLRDFKKHFFIAIPFIAYLLVYIFAIPNEPAHGWYRYPFYPFLLVSAAVILREEFRKISLITLIFILFVGLSLLSNGWNNIFGFSYPIYRIFIIGSSLPVLYSIWKNKQTPKLLYFWLSVFIALNILSVLSYVE